MKAAAAILNKKGGNAIPTLIASFERLYPQDACVSLLTPTEVWSSKIGEAATKSFSAKSSIIAGFASTKHPNEVATARFGKATLALVGRTYPETKQSLVDTVASGKDNFANVQTFGSLLARVEGDFAIFIAQENKFLAARDPVGVQPLYYGETETTAALATNRTLLWNLGIKEPKSFPPGNTATITSQGFSFVPYKALKASKPKPISMEQAAKELHALLEQSVKIRVAGQKKIAVAFSGGLDSSIIAHLAKSCGAKVELIHVSLENQQETEEARKAAEILDLPIQVCLYKEADVEATATTAVKLIEDSDPVKASVGIPFLWNAQRAAESGLSVMLAGQGADELFGGYKRYVTEYISKGEEAVRETMFLDVLTISESNIERDEKICNYHDVELRLPFASFTVAEYAMSLPIELKFEPRANSLRKLVLRKAAEKMGLPKEITEKPKKAVQYSTGINSALRKIAKRNEMTLADYVNCLFFQAKTNS